MSDAERNKIEEIIDAMSNEEKVVVVRSIDTDILQGEISRRLNRDREQKNAIIGLANSMEKY